MHTRTPPQTQILCSHTWPGPRPPSARRGVRYGLTGLLAVTIGAVLTGARSFAAIGEWAADLSSESLHALALDRAPDESSLRKLFARIDAAALDLCLAAYAFTRTREISGRRVIAIDGKTLRGARAGAARAPHLIAALDHETGTVLGQDATSQKSNEIPAVRDLISTFDPADLADAVITVDAMHCQTGTAEAITAAGADYVFTVKGNQARLLADLKALPWKDVPATINSERHRGGRTTRTIKVVQVPLWINFAGAKQVAQVRRTRTVKGHKTVEVVYLITSADHRTAPPEVLAGWVRCHWSIENRLHWVRDVTFDEDRSQVRTGSEAWVMASIRNTAIGILRLLGWANIAQATRHYARRTDKTITCLLSS